MSINAVMTKAFGKEFTDFIEAKLYEVQRKRLEMLNNLTLVEVFKGRNLFYLRASEHSASQLMSNCLELYLAMKDEAEFAGFSRELLSFIERRNLPNIEPSKIIEYFARGKLPLWTEHLESYDKCLHRLLLEFYQQLCNEDATIDWERLSRFIVDSDARENHYS